MNYACNESLRRVLEALRDTVHSILAERSGEYEILSRLMIASHVVKPDNTSKVPKIDALGFSRVRIFSKFGRGGEVFTTLSLRLRKSTTILSSPDFPGIGTTNTGFEKVLSVTG